MKRRRAQPTRVCCSRRSRATHQYHVALHRLHGDEGARQRSFRRVDGQIVATLRAARAALHGCRTRVRVACVQLRLARARLRASRLRGAWLATTSLCEALVTERLRPQGYIYRRRDFKYLRLCITPATRMVQKRARTDVTALLRVFFL